MILRDPFLFAILAVYLAAGCVAVSILIISFYALRSWIAAWWRR